MNDFVLEVLIGGNYENSLMIPVKFRYDPLDAAFIKVTFMNAEHTVDWEIGREILATGIVEQVEAGEVKITPLDDGTLSLEITGEGKDGEDRTVTVFFDLMTIATFIHSTFVMVPLGHEFDHLDWNTLLKSE